MTTRRTRRASSSAGDTSPEVDDIALLDADSLDDAADAEEETGEVFTDDDDVSEHVSDAADQASRLLAHELGSDDDDAGDSDDTEEDDEDGDDDSAEDESEGTHRGAASPLDADLADVSHLAGVEVEVIPPQDDEFICVSCWLVQHISRRGDDGRCRDCD